MDKRKHDLHLIREWMAGNEEAGHQLVNENQKLILGYILKLSFNYSRIDNREEIVHEVYQEALTRAFESAYKFTGKSSFSTWVCGIVDRCFKEKTRELLKLSHEELNQIIKSKGESFYGNPESIYIRNEQKNEIKEMVWEAMASLKPEYIDIIIWRILEGKSFSEIEELTGKSTAALDSLSRRAKDAFRKEYLKLYKAYDGISTNRSLSK